MSEKLRVTNASQKFMIYHLIIINDCINWNVAYLYWEWLVFYIHFVVL